MPPPTGKRSFATSALRDGNSSQLPGEAGKHLVGVGIKPATGASFHEPGKASGDLA
ncbi:MAG: hypothetical protein OXS47_00215 [Chloroflexota bacterium]|nr:hypothetical protein [Chloroflexota bacterium]